MAFIYRPESATTEPAKRRWRMAAILYSTSPECFMHCYDPDEAPDPDLGPSLDERERIRLAKEFHGTPRTATAT